MDLYEFFSTLRDGLAQDVELNTWAVSQFGQGFNIFAGVPADSIVDMQDQCPFIALSDPQDKRSQTERFIGYSVSGWVGLKNDSTELGNALANVTEPQGVKQIIDALKMTRDAIAAVLPEGVEIEEFQTVADTLGAHDDVSGYFEATFIERIAFPQNPLA